MLLCLQASYALGYNLAIEYLADYEKTWMLDSFRAFDAGVLAPQGRRLREWLFLEARVPIQLLFTLLLLHCEPCGFIWVMRARGALLPPVRVPMHDSQPHKLGTAACNTML